MPSRPSTRASPECASGAQITSERCVPRPRVTPSAARLPARKASIQPGLGAASSATRTPSPRPSMSTTATHLAPTTRRAWTITEVSRSSTSSAPTNWAAEGVTRGRGTQRSDVIWAPLAHSGLALVLGREGMPYRSRELRQVSALARVVDTRLRELHRAHSRARHPSR